MQYAVDTQLAFGSLPCINSQTFILHITLVSEGEPGAMCMHTYTYVQYHHYKNKIYVIVILLAGAEWVEFISLPPL